jgi:hypothetical protein
VSEGGQRAYRDRNGFLWLTADEPDKPGEHVFCYDDQAARRMSAKWPTRTRESAEEEFGPLLPMVQAAGAGDDIVLFLYGGGRSIPVPPDWAERRWGWDHREFQDMMPGYQILLLSAGEVDGPGGSHLGGAYVVIRRTG